MLGVGETVSARGWDDAVPLGVDFAAARDLDILEPDDDRVSCTVADGRPRVTRQNLASDGRDVESAVELHGGVPPRCACAPKHDVKPPVSDVARHPPADSEPLLYGVRNGGIPRDAEA